MTDEPTRSPLVDIEHRVQARAKDLHLDLRTAADRAVLHDLVEREIHAWASEYQRGLQPYDLSNPEVVADRVMRNLAGYGPLEPLLRYNPPPRPHAANRNGLPPSPGAGVTARQRGSAASPPMA